MTRYDAVSNDASNDGDCRVRCFLADVPSLVEIQRRLG
jgi:hypothetical protein